MTPINDSCDSLKRSVAGGFAAGAVGNRRLFRRGAGRRRAQNGSGEASTCSMQMLWRVTHSLYNERADVVTVGG